MGNNSEGMSDNSMIGRDFATWYLPYCLQRLSDGTYLPLNRAYKPVGLVTGDWVDYEEAPARARLRLTDEEAAAIDHNGKPYADGTVFLYDDSSFPTDSSENWESYLGRLSLLAGYRMED